MVTLHSWLEWLVICHLNLKENSVTFKNTHESFLRLHATEYACQKTSEEL